MSRLIVKGLPTYLSDARLRDHFSQRGAVTDVKLMTRPDGTSRRFGFVGYRSNEEALDALKYFDKTFIDTSRINVEIARKIGDEELKERKEERIQLKRKNDSGVIEEVKKSDEPAPKKVKAKASKGVSYEDFMAVMAPKSKRKTWQNEEANVQQTMEDIVGEGKEQPADKKQKKDKKVNAPSEASPAADDQELEKDEAVNDEGLTDLEYMKQRMKHRVGVEEEKQEKAFEQSDDEEEAAAESESESEDEETVQKQQRERLAAKQAAAKEQKMVDEIMESGRLFIRNLPFSASEDDVKDFFDTFGTVTQVHILLDKETKASKGLGFVTFAEPVHALSAFRAKDGSTFQGRLLHLIPAVDKKSKPEASKTLKQSKQEQRKADASKDFNWCMLYMNSDAVASSVADRLGVLKSDILNPQDAPTDNAAVRLALAETRIIQETKEFLADEGIDVDTFDRKERSETTILVKNIPYGTTVEEIEELFSKHGHVGKVLIPPTGTIAVVDMPVVGESRVAFRSLAYKRFKNSILYLEKAPAGVLTSSTKGDSTKLKQAPLAGKEAPKPLSTTVVLGAGTGTESEAESGATLYIKNLNFSTTDEKLGVLFSGLSDYAFARIQTKPDPSRPGARLSMGYGFVGFKSVSSAQSAQKAIDGHILDGHTLSVTFAKRGQEPTSSSGVSKSTTTKIIVKNLPFQATKRDIRELFASQGQLKSVRLPKKFDSKTRGFAFVEYISRREAESAFENLKHTHLLGRHLVLQWSDASVTDVENVRKKTASSFIGTTDQGHRKQVAGKKGKIKLAHEDIVSAVKAAKKQSQTEDDEEDL